MLKQIDEYRLQLTLHEERIAERIELANRTREHMVPEEEDHHLAHEVEAFMVKFESF